MDSSRHQQVCGRRKQIALIGTSGCRQAGQHARRNGGRRPTVPPSVARRRRRVVSPLSGVVPLPSMRARNARTMPRSARAADVQLAPRVLPVRSRASVTMLSEVRARRSGCAGRRRIVVTTPPGVALAPFSVAVNVRRVVSTLAANGVVLVPVPWASRAAASSPRLWGWGLLPSVRPQAFGPLPSHPGRLG